MAKLETDVGYMRRDIAELKSDVKAISADLMTVRLSVSRIDTQLAHLDKHMVTKAQLASYALLSLLPVLGGGWWIVQQYLAPMLKALPQ